MRHSFIDRYAGLDSPLHALDARTKIIGFVAMIVAVLFVPAGRTFAFFAYFFLAAILMGISQIPLSFIIGRALVLFPFVLMAGFSIPWRGGSPWGALGTLFMRSFLSLLLLILLTNTTKFAELLRGLRRLGCPRILVLILGFLYRYVFVLTEEIMRMRLARECRRVGPAAARAELRLIGSMLGTLLLRSFERAERMFQAILSRGYSGEFPVYGAPSFGWGDLAFLAGLSLVFVLTFVV